MEKILLILLIFALILWVLSFFMKDPNKQLREEMDSLFMQQLEEIYHIKKKLKVLEEELLLNDLRFKDTVSEKRTRQSGKSAVHEIIKNQVWSLAQQGVPLPQIAEQSSLTIADVQSIITEFTKADKSSH